jgi:hypothetical protein
MDLVDDTLGLLGQLKVQPWRLSIDTHGAKATVPMFRGVWGKALYGLDPRAYEEVFTGTGAADKRTPRYLLQALPPEPGASAALNWTLVGRWDQGCTTNLLRAWDIASGMGLGPDRVPFHIRRIDLLGPDGRRHAAGPLPGDLSPWSLSLARWPLSGEPATTPCALVFPTSSRLIKGSALLLHPRPVDVVAALCRRLEQLMRPAQPVESDPPCETRGGCQQNDPGPREQAELNRLRPALQGAAQALRHQPWQGSQRDVVRWSARQRQEVELRAVTGQLALPDGPGPLWPLFLSGAWLGVGKGTTSGLGQLVIAAL